MAIKTKKIAELSEITSNGSFLLGQNGNVTGKISYSTIMNEVDEKITTAIASIPTTDEDTSTNEDTVTNDRFISLSNKVENNTTQISTVVKTQATLESVVVSSTEKSLLLEQKVQELSGKVAALESFVKALQEEGYLTLAKIKQAAADNCPICNHEHTEVTEEPEQPTE
jgi:seryl-tRNA synthetase